jgi:hypothetical protein
MVPGGLLRADRFVHDLVQFLKHLGYVSYVAFFFKLFVNRLNVVVPLRERVGTRLHEQGLKANENLPRQDFKAALHFV